MSTYRAAYWISEDRQATVRLTGPDQADLPSEQLLALAKSEARVNEIDLSEGRIVLAKWRAEARDR